MGWRITFDGQVYNQSDLSIADADELDRVCGETWVVLRPQDTPMRLARVTAWLHARRTSGDYDELVKKTSSLPAMSLVEGLGIESDDLPTEYLNGVPPEAADTETPG